MIFTVTDNAANFVKAFRDFGISLRTFTTFLASREESESDNLHDSQTENSFVNELDLSHEEDETAIDFLNVEGMILSAHFRCGSYTLCLFPYG